MRCILGGDPERPQIEMHIDNMIKAVRGLRSRIVDSGVKLAVENHGGDLQAREMKMMIEAVGTDVMGVCLDSGNPVWMLEDPHMTLEMLIPYAETCHVRDSAVWKVPEGIAVRWVNMGDGNVDIDGWIKKFIQAKPGLPIIFENLVSGEAADSRDLRPEVLGQLAQDAGVGVQPIPGGRGEGHAEAGGAAAGRQDGRSAAQGRSGTLRAVYAGDVEADVRREWPERGPIPQPDVCGHIARERLNDCERVMQETKRLRIKIDGLPLRARKLNPDELGAVFGGCDANGAECSADKGCCSLHCGGGMDAVQADGSVKSVRPNTCQL